LAQARNTPVNRKRSILVAAIGAVICLSCSAIRTNPSVELSYPANNEIDHSLADGRFSSVQFQDHTQEIIGDALKLIAKNQREGAPLDQRWYAFRRFRENLQSIFNAREIRFYGGREIDVRSVIAQRYISWVPFDPDQSSSDIRLFTARRNGDGFDLVIIGQNGREVALKTAIRLIYLFKFTDENRKRTFPGGLDAFVQRIKIFVSSITPKQEFIAFFKQHEIDNPDAVLIGFQGDTRAVLKEAGIEDPKRHSDDSLRVNWYPNANGKKVLLVSINGNRIFASRAGELVRAIFETFHSPPRALLFFGSGGAIAAADLVGQIVAPTVVVKDDFFVPDQPAGKLAQIIRNCATTILPLRSAHVSVENMVVETMNWAALKSRNRITTVDQELYHVVNAVNAAPYGGKLGFFVGILVTDDVSTLKSGDDVTLQFAEDTIARTTEVRREFIAKILAEIGIIRETAETQLSTSDVDERSNFCALGRAPR
jgi:hypothetical protein